MEKYTDLSVSVIIPTYRRATLLLQALGSLQKQSFTDFDIVVVDNAADPEIAESLNAFSRTTTVPVRYLPEPNLGAHHARHAGARVTKSGVLLFGDDDQTFDRKWVEAYARAFANHPSMAAAGGPIKARWASTPPSWMTKFVGQHMREKKMFPILSLIDLSTEFRLNDRGIFFSGNMGIRRTALFELGGFGPDLFGDRQLGNGETGLNQRLSQKSMMVGYVPDAVSYHYISSERMTVQYFKRRMENEGACDMYTRFHDKLPGTIGLWYHFVSIMVRNCFFWLIEPLVSDKTSWLSLQIQLRAARARSHLTYVRRLLFDKDFSNFVLRSDWL